MKRTILILGAASALALTACSAPATSPSASPDVTGVAATPTPTVTPKVMKPGAFTFENSTGTKGTMQVPGKPDAEIERLRTLAGTTAAVTYLSVHVDNRAGMVGANMYGVSIFTPTGEELKYKNADDYIGSITPSGAPAAVYNQFIAAGNKHMEMASPKAVKDFVLTGPPIPAEISGITVYPTGMADPTEAVPAN